MVENFPKLMKDIKPQTPGALRAEDSLPYPETENTWGNNSRNFQKAKLEFVMGQQLFT